MPVYDFSCQKCGTVFEAIRAINETADCPNCGGPTKKLISASGVNCFNDNAEWIRSVTEVVDKEGGPAAQQFLKHPNRTNYRKWMKEAGVRHWEKGEPIRPESPDTSRLVDQTVERFRERERIEV